MNELENRLRQAFDARADSVDERDLQPAELPAGRAAGPTRRQHRWLVPAIAAAVVALVAIGATALLRPGTGHPEPAGRGPTKQATAAVAPRLGVPTSFGPHGTGWGQSRPAKIDNGGDPSGIVDHLRWDSWGGATAIGHGRTSLFKPSGGYYPRMVRIQLRAGNLGSCTAGGRPTYRGLMYRLPNKPGGRLGPWKRWAGYHPNLCSTD